MAPFPHPINKDIVKSSRIVCLPHWQGYGVGSKMSNTVCGFDKYKDKDVHATTTLPIRQAYLSKSPLWVLKSQGCWETPTTGNISKQNRANVYLETHKFMNGNLNENDIKPKYAEIPEGIKKKTNDHKMDMILKKIEENKIRKAKLEEEKQLKQVEEEKDANYYDDLMSMFG